jgi:hypothetical protein
MAGGRCRSRQSFVESLRWLVKRMSDNLRVIFSDLKNCSNRSGIPEGSIIPAEDFGPAWRVQIRVKGNRFASFKMKFAREQDAESARAALRGIFDWSQGWDETRQFVEIVGKILFTKQCSMR